MRWCRCLGPYRSVGRRASEAAPEREAGAATVRPASDAPVPARAAVLGQTPFQPQHPARPGGQSEGGPLPSLHYPAEYYAVVSARAGCVSGNRLSKK